MDEQRGVSSGFAAEPASDSVSLGEKRKGNGLEDEKDESGSKRVKMRDLDSAESGNIGIAQQPNLSSEQMLVAPKELLSKDAKPSTVCETNTCFPKSESISTDDVRCVPKSGEQVLHENHTVKDDSSKGGHVDGVLKNGSRLKPKEVSEPVGSAAGSLGKSDSMRRWMEMKRNGFVSGPLGGVAAPSSTVPPSTPVEVPAQKQPKVNKRRGGDALKKRNEAAPKKDQQQQQQQQQQVDRFSNITAPSGLLTELNPGIINRVRTRKQVCSVIEALIRNADSEGRQHNMNVRESVRQGRALAFKLPSTTDPEQATSLVEAATVASQWLEFLHQDLNRRLSAVQDSRKRVQNILTTELPLLLSSTESSPDKESTNMNTSGDETVAEPHQIRWSAKFDELNKALCEEEIDLERSLKQVKEMQSRCNDGLSLGKEGSEETSMAVQAAAASIFSTCSYLLSMMNPPPPPTSS